MTESNLTRNAQAPEEAEERPASLAGVITVALCCVVAFLDGADTQSLAIAAPTLASELTLLPGQVGLIFSISLLGAALGAITCGSFADRFGPKRMLVATTLLLGGFQLATAYATAFTDLLAYRFLAGVGLGGATPCFLALAGAHASERMRTTLFGVIWAFFPIGGFVGGFLNGWLLQHADWRLVFQIGGALPIITAGLIVVGARDVPYLPKKGDEPITRGKLGGCQQYLQETASYYVRRR